MTRTPTLPFDDRRMWRRLVGRSHPDAGGDDELFVWTVATRDAVCGGELEAAIARVERRAPSTQGTGERVSFDEDASLEVLTDRAIAGAEAVVETGGCVV
jgi:hypothetical protein